MKKYTKFKAIIITGLEKTETAMIEKRVVTMREMKFTTGVRRCRGNDTSSQCVE